MHCLIRRLRNWVPSSYPGQNIVDHLLISGNIQRLEHLGDCEITAPANGDTSVVLAQPNKRGKDDLAAECDHGDWAV